MVRIELVREIFADDYTLGAIYLNGGRICFTCEDAVREVAGKHVSEWKIAGQTAIPYGEYELVNSMSSRFKKLLPELLNVEGFAGVRLHGGNTSKDTEGCPLLGLNRTDDGVSNCAPAVAKIMTIVENAKASGGKVFIKVRSANV